MDSYNVAVTVGPNIFRPRVHRSTDLFKVAVYYQALITMIDQFDELFD